MQSRLMQIMALLFVMPLLGVLTFSVIPQFWAYWLTFLVVALGAFSIATQEAWQRLRIPQSALIWIILLGILVLQSMLNMLHSIQVSLTFVGYMVSAFIMTIIGSHLRLTLGWKKFVYFCAIFSMVSALSIAIILMFGAFHYHALAPLKSVTVNYREFSAALLGIGLVSTIYIAIQKSISIKSALICGFTLIASIAFLSNTDGLWIILGIVGVAVAQQVLAIKTQNGSKEKRDWVRVGLALLIVFALLCLLFPELDNKEAPWLDTVIVAFKIALQHPLFGVGAGNVGWQSFLAISKPAISGRVGVFAHVPNAWLQLTLEFGVIAVVALLVTLTSWLRGIAWKALQLEQVWLLSVMGVLLAISMHSSLFHHIYYLLIFAFLLGAGDESLSKFSFPRLGAGSAFLTGTALIVALATAGLANAKLIKAQADSLAEASTLENLQWAHRYSLLSPYVETLFAKKINIDNQNTDTKLWITEHAMRFQPNMTIAYYHSVLLEINGQHTQAVEFLKYTLNAYPIKLSAMLQLLPVNHMQTFLNVLSGARPIHKSKVPLLDSNQPQIEPITPNKH